MANVTAVNLLALATSLPYGAQLASIASNASNQLQLLAYHPNFTSQIVNTSVPVTLIANESYDAFHEAGIYDHPTNSLYIASNWNSVNTSYDPINISVYHFSDGTYNTGQVTSERYYGLSEANGGCTYTPPGTGCNLTAPFPPYQVWCDEGNLTAPSGLIQLDPSTGKTTPLLTNYLGRNFSSVNDIKQHYQTGDLWFTDAQYGYLQSFRQTPSIPPQVYRFEPETGNVQVVADGFVQPNGIEFSPDFKTLYVTDTGEAGRGTDVNRTRPATIYAYDVKDKKYAVNRRVFAYVDNGIPDGIHCDEHGNVWSSCGDIYGDGLHVWNPQGQLLGKMVVQGGSNNFAFVPGAVFVFNAEKVWRVGIKVKGRELARDFGV